MRLVSLELFGFKSFAQRTKLRFSEGITAIVGPNGCGKSNIVDAFRWVLGEPNARALRGEKMQDVIFAGTDKKKPQPFAEVTVTLTDVQGVLPVAYEEVALSRRVYRTGESEFRLNGQQVRMKDIQALLWDSGLGRQAFSVFEQGRIDQILQSSPAERRTLFEEVAGISRFKERRKETLRKLEENHAHLSRLQDIHQEVAAQVQILEKQAAVARKFREQKERADLLEKGIFASRYASYQQREQQLRQQMETLTTHGQELDQQRERHQESFLSSQQAVQQAQEGWDQERLAHHQNEQRLEAHKASLRALQRQREEASQRVVRFAQDEAALDQHLLSLEEEGQLLQQKRTEQQTVSLKGQGEFQAQQQSVDEAHRLWEEAQTILESCRERERAALMASQQAAEAGSAARAELERTRERLSQVQQRQNLLGEELQEAVAQEQERSQQLTQAQQGAAALRQQLTVADQQKRERQGEVETLQQQRRVAERERAALASQVELLTRLAQDHGLLGEGGNRLYQEAQRPQSALFGKLTPLSEFLTIPPGTEQLLATALGRAASALVVQDRETLEKALAFAQQEGLTDLVLLAPGEGHLSASLEALLGEQPVIGVLLEGLDLVESTRLLTAEIPSITLSGWMRDAQGLLVCGAGRAGDLVLHRAQLQKNQEALADAEEACHRIEESLRLAQHALVQAEQLRQQEDRELRKADQRQMELTLIVQQLETRIQQVRLQLEKLREEEARIAFLLEQLLEKELLQKQEAERWQEAVSSHQAQAAETKQLVQQRWTVLETQKTGLREAEQIWRRQQAESHQLANRHQVVQGQKEEAQKQKALLGGRTQEEQRRLATLEEESSQLLQELDALQHQVSCASLSQGERAQAMQVLRARAEEQQQALLQAGQQIRSLQTARQQLEQQIEAVLEHIEVLESNYAQRFFEPLCELALESGLAVGVSHAEKEVKALRQELEQVKDVNLAAIDELERIGERHRFLAQQLHDVAETERQLQEELHSLEIASRKIFKDSFEQIRQSFQKNFATLFEGGHADLKLAEGGDVLEAGIEITAQPPGKQMRILQLLSGGERSLTAMALLFAMFESKPAPFCLLDEMDAALDDANVDRFTRLLGNYLHQTQFLLITHNKRTMSAADLLLGVSMQEKGVSTVLALDFAETETPSLQVLASSADGSTEMSREPASV